jgi:hypothetical protein
LHLFIRSIRNPHATKFPKPPAKRKPRVRLNANDIVA